MIDYNIIWRKLNGEISSEEEEELNQWLQIPENEAYFEKAKQYQLQKASNKHIDPQTQEHDWMKIRGKLQTRNRGKKNYWLAAAVVILMFASYALFKFGIETDIDKPAELAEVENILPGSSKAVLIKSDGQQVNLEEQSALDFKDKDVSIHSKEGTLSYQVSNSSNNELYNTLIVPRGGKYTLQLSDGTKVWLNSETELKYPIGFSADSRSVELKGEAYFEVVSDQTRPFTVSTSSQSITVLGTSFNVHAYQEESMEVVTLAEGKVNVKQLNGDQSMLLNPDEQTVFDKAKLKLNKQAVDASLFTSWIEDLFVFEDQQLGEIMNRLSRWYDVDVFFENGEMASVKFTGEIERYESFENILKLIAKTNEVDFEIKGRTVVVK